VTRPVRARRRRRRVPGWARLALLALVGALLFLLGLGLGQALDDAPTPAFRTEVRTLRPLPLAPARDTVTVTVTATSGG
jgi:hypothetical protein